VKSTEINYGSLLDEEYDLHILQIDEQSGIQLWSCDWVHMKSKQLEILSLLCRLKRKSSLY